MVAEATQRPGETSMTDNGTVLIVDDDSESVKLLTGMLSAEGYEVRSAATGTRALACVRFQRPALILLATRTAVIDGFEICRRLKRRERSRQIPVLFLTTRGEIEDQIEGLRTGAADFICKPFRQEEAIARIRTQMELGRLRAASYQSEIEYAARAVVVDARRESDGWIRLAMQAGRMYAFEWNPATDEIQRSQSSAEILGIVSGATRDTSQNWFQLIHPEDRERFQQILSFLSPAYDTFDTQYRVIRPDGRTIHLRESARGFFDDNGRLTRLIGIVADVTEQTQAEKAFERSEAGLMELIRKVPIAIAFAGEQGRIEYVNDRFVENFGYDLDEIADIDAWWERAYPDERYRREVIESWDNSVETANREGKDIEPREYRVTCKDGTIRTAEIFGATVGDRRLILFNDVTERKRAEAALRESQERFRDLANGAPAGIYTSDAENRLTFCNQYALTLVGRGIEELMGSQWKELVHPEDLDRFSATYAAAVETHRGRQFEYRLRRADGQYRWVLSTGTPRYTADGVLTGSIGILTDITDVKRNQERMLASQKLESLGVLASGVAHDFNNLLGCILADADLAIMELDADSPAREGLERIETVAIRASEIVRQMMAYAGQEKKDFESIDIARLVHEMLDLLRVSIPKNGTLRVDLPGDLPAVQANSAQIRQVVMNLILNAAEALGEQGGIINISARRVSVSHLRAAKNAAALPEGEYVRLSVSDTGSGMTEETRTRIFDPFFTTKFAGRGLGLAAVQGIVRSHGGSIEVRSTPGRGTTFQILLPCASDATVLDHAIGAVSSERYRPGTGSILVVEDEDTLRLSVSEMLRKRGFSVLEAGNGNLAVDLIRAQKEDIAVVLLDLTVPGKSSQEVFEELRRTRPDVKVILTSAHGRDRVDSLLRGLQNESFIRKPYHLGELVSVVRDALAPAGTAGSKQR